jgi:hypothetical protein
VLVERGAFKTLDDAPATACSLREHDPHPGALADPISEPDEVRSEGSSTPDGVQLLGLGGWTVLKVIQIREHDPSDEFDIHP